MEAPLKGCGMSVDTPEEDPCVSAGSSLMIPLSTDLQKGCLGSGAAADTIGSPVRASFIWPSESLLRSSASSSLRIRFSSLFLPILPASLEIGELATMNMDMIITARAMIMSPGLPKNLTRSDPISIPTAPPKYPSTPVL